jgi:hypothetical protein
LNALYGFTILNSTFHIQFALLVGSFYNWWFFDLAGGKKEFLMFGAEGFNTISENRKFLFAG